MTSEEVVSNHHAWIVASVLETGLPTGALAASTGLAEWRIAAFMSGESPSDIVTMCRIVTLLVRQRAKEWAALTD